MKIKSKKSRRPKTEIPTKPDVENIPPMREPSSVPDFSQEDFAPVPEDKPKRKYTRRNALPEVSGISFGKLLVFAGQTASKLSSLITKQDAPLNETETEMLNVVGDTCGKFLIDESQIEEAAPKYAKYAVIGVLGLVVGVRAIDYFMRPRLTAGQSPSISYDVVQDDVSEHHG